MSERIAGFVVVLDDNMHEEDAERLRMAILALKHVVSVETAPASMGMDYFSRVQERHDIAQKIMPILFPPFTK